VGANVRFHNANTSARLLDYATYRCRRDRGLETDETTTLVMGDSQCDCSRGNRVWFYHSRSASPICSRIISAHRSSAVGCCRIVAFAYVATGSSIRELARLRKFYGRGRWRKRKGIARVRLESGEMRLAEVHWYEAHGIGRKEFKIKRYID
jgi:hypothetical protein